MGVKFSLPAFFLLFSLSASAQPVADSLQKPDLRSRRWMVGGGSAAILGTSFIGLNEAWYKDYPRSKFHAFNDAGEWKQMDKIGHAWTAYAISRPVSQLWQWAGVEKNKAVWLGAGTSLAYLLSIEYLDGRSAEWGWSWADVGADFSGALLYAGQEALWNEQRFYLKWSGHVQRYDDPELEDRADELFGRSGAERIFKDYNAQTYWISANLHAFFPRSKIPAWLNLSIGHGARGMFGGYENLALDANNNIRFDRRDLTRRRQWYLAPDIDFTRIPTRSRFLRSAFSVLNIVKFPAPALELSSGRLRFRGLVF